MKASEGFGKHFQDQIDKMKTDAIKWHCLILFLILLIWFLQGCLPSLCHANDKWTKQDYILEGTWVIFHLLDWGTTRNIDGVRYKETGPAKIAIGECPSKESVDIYMGLGLILHPLITDLMPRKAKFLWIENLEWYPRTTWQSVTIGGSGYCALNNLSIGLKVEF